MTVGFRDDLACSILLFVPVLLYANMGVDPLYAGVWYLLGVPLAALVPGLILRVPALFLTGTTAAVIASLLVYMNIMFSLPRSEGLLVLGHLFSMPGLLVGAGVSAWLLRCRVKASLPWLVAAIAFLGAIIGFMIAQMILCSTLMYCGALSFGVGS
ncbi:hypothetical protein DKY63_31500 [Pseudomonas putida]|uniref:Uncharacterized protein n=1 Tax=Pseudomonas putida TaxID=303 RepID=A0A2Z4RSM5_PSEPU|nr:hypothetical protein [Pseudomonas putida]AWY44193.1 hypothetical protein DKY63_31500 [Pseudomonas putida]